MGLMTKYPDMTTEMVSVSRPSEESATRPEEKTPSWLPLAALLIVTAVLLLAGLSRSGWANDYYAAAVQAGTQSWKALLFGSADAGNVVTVDKPPAALWIMGLSARIFGLSSWSLLVPQALEGVAAVAILYATVRRWFGPAAGLLAGAIFALTPVAVLMFRFDNPDALLVLLMVTGAYGVTRATENGSGRWLALAGTAIGFAFLTKLLQAFLVVPGFALVYLVAAPVTLRRRLLHLAGAGLAIIVSAGWYVALVALWPQSSRPYIGGSQGNSLLELTIGYNGLGRILGHEGHGGPGGPRGAGAPHFPSRGGHSPFGGAAGLTRLFGGQFATQISWLLPAALIALGAGLWLTHRSPRTDRTRAALILWGTWLLVSGLTFSYMKGIIHEYYTVALAPAVAVLLAVAVRILPRPVLALMSAATGMWGYVLLARTPHWFPALRWVVLAAGLVVALALLVPRRRLRRAGIVVTVGALVAAGLAPGAYAVDAAAKPHTGGGPTAGPSRPHRGGFPGGPTGSFPGAAGGGFRAPGGGQVNAAMVALLKGTTSTWAAATVSAMAAAPIQLAVRRPIMSIGGFSGTDPAPTLVEFQQDVRAGRVPYFIAGQRRGRGGMRQSGPGAQISAWVEKSFPPTPVGDATVYDLTSPR
jgi:4-amino-4-deoxy-L-arabinose transferase-like glycosyltransferase